MEKRTLGKTNLPVSVLGFGAAPVAFLESDRDRAAIVIDKLLAAGVNLIDTAASYPGSEEFLGERFSHRRHDFVLVSKCGREIPESKASAWSDGCITDTVDRALRLLKTDHLDVMLLHSCSLDILRRGEAIAALVKAKQAGKTRFIGYSGDNDAATYACSLKEIDVLETSISFVDQINIDHAMSIARQHNVGVIAKRPIANAAWKDLDEQPGMYRDYATEYTTRVKKLGITPSSVGFKPTSGKEEDAWPEMALRFTLSIEGIHTAIIGTTNPENASNNVRYASAGTLDQKVVKNLRDAFRKSDPEKEWTGQT